MMTKILIVDDDSQITAMLEKILSMDGFEVVSVNDSKQAMTVAASTNPNFFILDLMMPEPNGFEITRMLRADSKFAKTPILIITASDDADSKAIAYVAGADDYITKPFQNEDLTSSIRTLLAKIE